MADYIERGFALDVVKRTSGDYVAAWAEIAHAPAADVAPVVRCRECVSHSEDASTGKLWCTKPMGCIGCLEVKPDDFCSFGERKKAQDE